MEPALCCPKCHRDISGPPVGETACSGCGLVLRRTGHGVAYDYANLLRSAFPRRYPLYRALCNNGFVSYHELASGSLSLPHRPDVAAFGAFLREHLQGARWICDIGCGPLPQPGYLKPIAADGAALIGVDIYPTTFAGYQINGCAEFLPLRSHSIDGVIFATSLDHVCDLSATLGEVARMLSPSGRCCIWMSDRRPYWQEFFLSSRSPRAILRRLFGGLPRQVIGNVRQRRRLGYGILHYFTRGRYWEYDNGSVFYCPPGAIDPFHSFFERPDQVAAIARAGGLELTRSEPVHGGVFLCLAPLAR